MAVQSSKHLEKLAYDLKVDNFMVRTDVSEPKGGSDSAPDPHQYFEAALAGCTAITVQMYADHKKIPLKNVDVQITITKEGKEGNEIERKIRFEGELTDEQRKRLFEIAERCPIHRLISAGAIINSQLLE